MSSKSLNLLVFGLVSFFLLNLLAWGLYVPYLKAYALVHPVRTSSYRLPPDVGIHDYQTVEFPASDGLKLRGWYVPTRNGAVVIFVHGLGDNRPALLGEAGLLVARGYGALLFDLRNHGRSDGDRTTFGLYEANDAKGAFAFVRAQPGVDPARIGLMGISMGGATVLMAAAQLPDTAAVVAECAYTSLEDNIATGLNGLTGLPPVFTPLLLFFGQREAGLDLHTVRPLDVVGRIAPRPLLIVHGELDEIVPVQNAYRLYAAAREPKQLYVISNAGHGGYWQAAPQEYPQRILAFLEKNLR